MPLTHPLVLGVQRALRAAGQASAADGVQALPAPAPTAAAAAKQLGCPVGAIANSLIFRTGDAPVLILTSGAHRVDTSMVADLLGVASLDRADPDFVRLHTGQAIGGVAPVGHPAPIGTFVDVALASFDVVWAAAGHTSTVFPTTFDDLVTLTDGTAAQVAP